MSKRVLDFLHSMLETVHKGTDEWEDERSMDVIQQNLVLDNIGIGTCSLSGYISSYLAAKYYFLNHIRMLNVDINCKQK